MSKAPVVAVGGGGFTGAAVAFHLAQALDAQPLAAALEILVIEPRAIFAGGLASSTAKPAHRITLPASTMSLISADPGPSPAGSAAPARFRGARSAK